MAKFRTSHRRAARGKLGPSFKLVFLLTLGVVILLFSRPLINDLVQKFYPSTNLVNPDGPLIYYLPDAGSYPVYPYQGFTLAYDEAHEQARWVAYELTVAQLNAKKVSRTDYFKEDPGIRSGSASYYDYKNSGYTKGHLVPAADRAFSITTMEETFLMSNISPQIYECNGGIWRELEEQVRDWARQDKSVYIVTGPVISPIGTRRIGQNRVTVPEAFFKVILDHSDPVIKGIGFIVPNAISYRPLQDYAMTIDDIEEKTGIDFFHELFTDKLEDSIESQVNLDLWRFNEERFETRINHWNNR